MNAGISVGEHLVGEAHGGIFILPESDSLFFFFCSRCLRFRRNLADMFSFFIRSQHPLSAYC